MKEQLSAHIDTSERDPEFLDLQATLADRVLGTWPTYEFATSLEAELSALRAEAQNDDLFKMLAEASEALPDHSFDKYEDLENHDRVRRMFEFSATREMLRKLLLGHADEAETREMYFDEMATSQDILTQKEQALEISNYAVRSILGVNSGTIVISSDYQPGWESSQQFSDIMGTITLEGVGGLWLMNYDPGEVVSALDDRIGRLNRQKFLYETYRTYQPGALYLGDAIMENPTSCLQNKAPINIYATVDGSVAPIHAYAFHSPDFATYIIEC